MLILIGCFAAVVLVYFGFQAKSYIAWYCEAFDCSPSTVIKRFAGKAAGMILLILTFSYLVVWLLGSVDKSNLH